MHGISKFYGDVERLKDVTTVPWWFAENPLKIYLKINIPIEIFEIILFLYFPEKTILYNIKNQIMFSDDFVIIFLLRSWQQLRKIHIPIR